MQNAINVNGWNLVRVGKAEERRILDVELGERLGYAKPLRAVQKIIDGLISDGELPGVLHGDRTILISKPNGGTEQRTVKAYYLTEREALQVIAKSRTKIAHRITNEIIDVYLVIKNSSDNLLRAQVANLLARVAELDSPQLRKCEAANIRRRLRVLSTARNAEGKLSKRAAFYRVDHELRGRVGFPMLAGHRWESFPRNRLGDVLLALDEMEAEDMSLLRSQARFAATIQKQAALKLN